MKWYRLEFCIMGKRGSGKWLPPSDKAALDAHAKDGNGRYGAGSHWVAESDTDAKPEDTDDGS